VTLEGNGPVRENNISLTLLFLSTSRHEWLEGIYRN